MNQNFENRADSESKRANMKILWILLVAQITRGQDTIPTKKCCNEENNLLINNKCVPDKSGKSFAIVLKCDKFVLDPKAFEDDSYNITQAGLLLVHNLGSTIPPDE